MKAIALYTGGINEPKQVAVAANGTVFERWFQSTHFGNSWSKWINAGTMIADGTTKSLLGCALASANSPCINDRAYFKNGVPSVRLPNAA